MKDLFVKKQGYLNIQNDIVDYLNGKKEYPFNYEYLRFIILDNKNDVETFYEVFEDELKDLVYVNINPDNKVLIIYHNKERVLFEEYIDSISEDLGRKIKIFEGFKLSTKEAYDLVYIIKFIFPILNHRFRYGGSMLIRLCPASQCLTNQLSCCG